MNIKTCKTCLSEKPVTAFEKAKSCADGYRGSCKQCRADGAARRSKAWRERHPERAKEVDRRYRENNPEKLRETKAKHYQKNAEKYRAAHLQFYHDNKELCQARTRAWVERNKERRAAVMAAWKAANKDRVRANYARWHAANPEARRLINLNRRARAKGNGGTLSKGLRSKLKVLQRGKCACCGLPLGAKFHMDHIMPLALGGRNEDSNMQLLRAVCNLKKKAKHPVDYMRERGYLL